jgi:segregation and condensation protein B
MSHQPEPQEHELSVDEIEAAYLRALELAEAAEQFFPESSPPPIPEVIPAVEQIQARPVPSAPVESAPEIVLASWQVLEALLFVGGRPLTGRHLAELLGGSHTHEQVDSILDELNQRYLQEGRPYQIQLTEGGYRLLLRPEFEAVRSRVYGQGPKEVKLTQDALELLAYVAYQQPVTLEQAEETGKANVSGLLRQLLRRELISLQRSPETDTYHTTPRFLELFSLSSLDDLPQLMDFDLK